MVRTLPFFFCFFSTTFTVTFLPSFQSMSVPMERCKHSSSSSGSSKYVFVSCSSLKYGFSENAKRSWKPTLPSPRLLVAFTSVKCARIGSSQDWISSASIIWFWKQCSQKPGTPPSEPDTISKRSLKKGVFFFSYSMRSSCNFSSNSFCNTSVFSWSPSSFSTRARTAAGSCATDASLRCFALIFSEAILARRARSAMPAASSSSSSSSSPSSVSIWPAALGDLPAAAGEAPVPKLN
mmetsp:Transcript_47657/g.101754  ORF Transcript_47657/g.101754 Transcript_47657/m.101754 type:complete len:237 (-) Transcript_47657:428-1138(-)